MTQKEIDALQVGDIVIHHGPHGVRTRVVRNVQRVNTSRGGATPRFRTWYTFVKQTRSNWPACYTILYPRELLSRRYVATGKRTRLTSALDRRIARAIRCSGAAGALIVHQNEVVGVVS